MPVVAWVTIVIAVLIIAAAALGLIRVVGHLIAIHRTLVALTGGVGVVAEQTLPVPAALASVNASLKPVRDFCEGV